MASLGNDGTMARQRMARDCIDRQRFDDALCCAGNLARLTLQVVAEITLTTALVRRARDCACSATPLPYIESTIVDPERATALMPKAVTIGDVSRRHAIGGRLAPSTLILSLAA